MLSMLLCHITPPVGQESECSPNGPGFCCCHPSCLVDPQAPFTSAGRSALPGQNQPRKSHHTAPTTAKMVYHTSASRPPVTNMSFMGMYPVP